MPPPGARAGASWARRPAAHALVAALLIATSAGAAVIIARGHVGGEPTHPYGADAPEANSDLPMLYATRPVVLGVAPLARGRRYELVGYQLRSRFGTNLCLDIHILPDGAGHGCGNDRERTQRTVSGPKTTLVSGATEPEVARVEVRYRTATGSGTASAALLHVEGPALAKARVSDPFGFYVAELPGGVVDAVAEAYDVSGSSLWKASFLTLQSHAAPRRARPCTPARKARDIRCAGLRRSTRPG